MKSTIIGVGKWRDLEKVGLQVVGGEIKVLEIPIEGEGKGNKA